MTYIEAMKQALEALEAMQNAIYNIGGEHVIDLDCAVEKADVAQEAITSLRQAIATEESSATQEPVADIEKLKENSVGFCEVLTMDDVADIIVNAQKRTPPYEINYMTVMQLTEKKVLEKFK